MRNLLNRIVPIFMIITLLFITITGCSTQNTSANLEYYNKIDDVVSIYHDKGQFTGAVLVSKDGEVVYKKGFGAVEQKHLKIKNKPDTKFLLYSCTKQLTAMLTLQLVEKGKLSLEDKVTDILDYIPEGHFKKELAKITVYNLLTNTSGLSDYYRMIFSKLASKAFTSEEILNMLSKCSTTFEPGTKYSYSNTNFYLLGLIIEEITGKTYSEVLEENICKPLGMNNTGYTEKNIDFINLPFVHMQNLYSAGGIYSTVEDLHLWDLALYNDKLLSKEYREIMFEPFKDNYACGWAIEKNQINGENKTHTYHSGAPTIGMRKAYIVRTLEDKICVVILSNSGRIPTNMHNDIYNILYDIKIDEENE